MPADIAGVAVEIAAAVAIAITHAAANGLALRPKAEPKRLALEKDLA